MCLLACVRACVWIHVSRTEDNLSCSSPVFGCFFLRQGLRSPGWPPTCPDRNHLSLKLTRMTVTSSTGSCHLSKPIPTSLTYWPPEAAQGTSGSRSEPPGRCSCRHPPVSVPQCAGHLHPLERNGVQPEGGWNWRRPGRQALSHCGTRSPGPWILRHCHSAE